MDISAKMCVESPEALLIGKENTFYIIQIIPDERVRFMVLNVTFNNISVIL